MIIMEPIVTSDQPASRRDVVIWLFSLQAPAHARAMLAGLLSSDERARAARFIHDLHRDRYIVAHGAMRCILAETLGRAPEELAFVSNAWGKPELAEAGAPFFNLSHTANLGALAIGWRCPIGVDVEQVRPVEPEVTRHTFSPAELAELSRLPRRDWLQGFYCCWTRKEAVIKALGLGLAQPLDAFDVTLAPDAPPRLLRLAGQPDAPSRWQLVHFAPADDILGAFAAPLSGHEISFRRWAPPDDLPGASGWAAR